LLDVTRPVPPQPPGAWGAGATVYFLMDSPQRDGIWFGKMIDWAHGPVFNVGQRADAGKERVNKFIKMLPAEHANGVAHLRARRHGAQLSVYGTDAQEDWRLLHEWEVSSMNVSMMRFGADPVSAPGAAIDMRLVDITISAEEFVGLRSD